MNGTAATRYTYGSTILALAVGAPLLAIGWSRGALPVFWALLGWAIIAGTAVLGGGWIARRHGRPDAGFFVALGTCMLARLIAASAGAAAAASQGMAAVWAYLAGLGATFLPLQVFEIGWFLRASRPPGPLGGATSD